MADKIPLVVQPPKTSDTHTDLNVDLAQALWPIAAIVIATLVFFALKNRFFPGVKLKTKDGEVELGGRQSDAYVGPDRRQTSAIDIKSIQLVQVTSRRRIEASNKAWARQKALVEDVEDEFWPMLSRLVKNPHQVDSAWSRYAATLRAIANFNHVTEAVTPDGEIHPDYLNDKVVAFRRRYEKLLTWPGNALPEFKVIEEQIRSLTASVVGRFIHIATEEDAILDDFVLAMKRTTDNEQLKTLLDEAAKRPRE